MTSNDWSSERSGIAEISVAKNRHGRTGDIEYYFAGFTTTFKPLKANTWTAPQVPV